MNDTETPFCEVDEDGTQNWYVVRSGERVRHRLDGPAVEKIGTQKMIRKWYRDGELHRDDGPAFETITSVKTHREWHVAGKLHRVDGPAIEHTNKNQPAFMHEYWYRDGELHRDDGGPAMTKCGKFFSPNFGTTYSDVQKWFENGELHYDGGPAVEHGNRSEWHWRGNWIPASVVRTTWFTQFSKEYCELLEEFGRGTLDRIKAFNSEYLQRRTMKSFFENPDNITLFRVVQTRGC